MGPQPLQAQAHVTDEEANRDPRMLATAMHHAIDRWFDSVGRWQRIVDPPSMHWTRLEYRMAATVTADGTVVDVPPVDFAETIQFFADMTQEARKERGRHE